MSLGNLALEFFAPLGVFLSVPFSCTEGFFRALLCLLAFFFHLSVFLMLGPNFVRHCMLVIVACVNPLSPGLHCLATREPTITSQYNLDLLTIGDRVRGVAATLILLGWFGISIHSDISHLLGHTPPHKKTDPIWPISEMSMFAKPSADVSFRMTGMIAISVLAALLARMCTPIDIRRV